MLILIYWLACLYIYEIYKNHIINFLQHFKPGDIKIIHFTLIIFYFFCHLRECTDSKAHCQGQFFTHIFFFYFISKSLIIFIFKSISDSFTTSLITNDYFQANFFRSFITYIRSLIMCWG